MTLPAGVDWEEQREDAEAILDVRYLPRKVVEVMIGIGKVSQATYTSGAFLGDVVSHR